MKYLRKIQGSFPYELKIRASHLWSNEKKYFKIASLLFGNRGGKNIRKFTLPTQKAILTVAVATYLTPEDAEMT